MTAILAIATNNAAYVLADGAYVDRYDGCVRAIDSKIFVAARDRSAVLALSGPRSLYTLLRDPCRSFSSFDDAVNGLESEVISISKTLPAGFYSIRLVGWSKARRRAEVHKICGGSWTDEPSPTPKLIEIRLSVVAPQDPLPIPTVTRQFHQQHKIGCAPPFSAVVHALPFFEAARCLPSSLNGKHVVGGFIEEVKVTAAGACRRFVANWHEDKIGEPITPCRAAETA